MPFTFVTAKRPAYYGGGGTDSRMTVGLGSFASVDLAVGSVLYGCGERVPLSIELYERGQQVRVQGTRCAYDMRIGSENRPLYYINCADRTCYHNRYPDWKFSNCEWVRQGSWLAVRITRPVSEGAQLLLPHYFREV